MKQQTAQQVLDFWFDVQHQEFWFKSSHDFDLKIQQQFEALHHQAKQGELWQWRDTAQGCLAEIIILDQFSRNLYRGQAAAFAQDSMALTLAQEAIRRQYDQQLTATERSFIYLPFMHSESRLIHQQAVILFQQLANPVNLDFEYQHQAIIERFGRYPHRNQVLGRVSTAEEIEFLQTHHGF